MSGMDRRWHECIHTVQEWIGNKKMTPLCPRLEKDCLMFEDIRKNYIIMGQQQKQKYSFIVCMHAVLWNRRYDIQYFGSKRRVRKWKQTKVCLKCSSDMIWDGLNCKGKPTVELNDGSDLTACTAGGMLYKIFPAVKGRNQNQMK